MAKANVNISDVNRFLSAINTQYTDIQATINRMQNMVGVSIESVAAEIQKAERAIAECEKQIGELNEQKTQLEAERTSLESELASTPPTITESYEDENGETKTREVPNPAYAALQQSIAQVSFQIDAVESAIQVLTNLKTQLINQKAILISSMRQLNECNSNLSASLTEFGALSQEASSKLSNALQVLQEYSETPIAPPTLAGKRMSGGYAMGGSGNSSKEMASGHSGSAKDSSIAKKGVADATRIAASLGAIALTMIGGKGFGGSMIKAEEALSNAARNKTEISRSSDAKSGFVSVDKKDPEIERKKAIVEKIDKISDVLEEVAKKTAKNDEEEDDEDKVFKEAKPVVGPDGDDLDELLAKDIARQIKEETGEDVQLTITLPNPYDNMDSKTVTATSDDTE